MNPTSHRFLLVFTSLTAAVSLALLFGWGPLTPPGGAVTSTAKPLSEVEPRIAVNAINTPPGASSIFRISAPGSYYLTGNITGISAKHGIDIATSGVTLDLNGFDLVGVSGSLNGVLVSSTYTDIAIRNGSIRNWGGYGVDAGTLNARNCRLDDLRVSGNGSGGIFTGVTCSVTNCSAYSNTGDGFTANITTAFSNCAAYNNTGDGFDVSNGVTLSGCCAYANAANGILAGLGTTIVNCSLRFNTLDGIQVSSTCYILNNTCTNNGFGAGDGAGIHALGVDNRIEGNVSTGADRGIDVDVGGNFITRNTCSGNTTNWDVVAGNVILVVNGVAAGAVLGNTGGVAPGSTDPNANFTY